MFIFIEDTDPETGGEQYGCAYAWISPMDYFDRTGHLKDNLRTSHLTAVFPTFAGVDDMESHFEFAMTREQMREHLLDLGFVERTRRSR